MITHVLAYWSEQIDAVSKYPHLIPYLRKGLIIIFLEVFHDVNVTTPLQSEYLYELFVHDKELNLDESLYT